MLDRRSCHLQKKGKERFSEEGLLPTFFFVVTENIEEMIIELGTNISYKTACVPRESIYLSAITP